MKKNLLLTLIFSASVFFVFLGMRNPILENNPGPKQRPRAITENVVKASQEICSKICTAIDLSSPLNVALPASAAPAFVQESTVPTFAIPANPASRAPPRTFFA